MSSNKSSSNNSNNNEIKRPSKLSPITVPLTIAKKTIGYLFLSIIIGTAVDYLGYFLDWWEYDHQLQVLASDIGYLGDNFTISIFGQPPAELALAISQRIKQWMTFSIYIGHQEFFFMQMVKGFFQLVEPFWQNLVYSAMTVGVRVFIIIMSISFFVVVAIVAAIDGLTERELRKEGGGIEHSKLYHHAKAWTGRVLVVSPIIYLSWPETINPGVVILPAAAFFGMAVYVTFFTFKKHL